MSGCSFGADCTSNLFVAVVRRAQDIARAMCFNVPYVGCLWSMALASADGAGIPVHAYELGSVPVIP